MQLLARNVASINADASIKCLRWLVTFSRFPSISQVQFQVPQILVVVIETSGALYSKCFSTRSRSVIGAKRKSPPKRAMRTFEVLVEEEDQMLGPLRERALNAENVTGPLALMLP